MAVFTHRKVNDLIPLGSNANKLYITQNQQNYSFLLVYKHNKNRYNKLVQRDLETSSFNSCLRIPKLIS